jgi:pimeloyl-ACP methyl ester carboxylesterase
VDHFTRQGLKFDVSDAGPAGGEGVVLLHGYPQAAASWREVVPGLAQAGYRTLAPDQRGYSPGARPQGRKPYVLRELMDDVLALADEAGLDRFHVVGHDWGGAVAWGLATDHPARLRTVTVLSTPHPEAFLRSMVSSTQLLRSLYMVLFQIPLLPEWLTTTGDGRLARRALRRSGLPAELVEEYVERLMEPGAITAALNWYRALPLQLGDMREVRPVTVPTMFVWSSGDVALGRTAAELTGRYVVGPYRFEVLDGVSHWIPEEVPHVVVRLLLEHLRS